MKKIFTGAIWAPLFIQVMINIKFSAQNKKIIIFLQKNRQCLWDALRFELFFPLFSRPPLRGTP